MKTTRLVFNSLLYILATPFWLALLALLALYAVLLWFKGLYLALRGHRLSFTTPFDPHGEESEKAKPAATIVNNIYTGAAGYPGPLANPYAAFMPPNPTQPASVSNVTNNTTTNNTVNNFYVGQKSTAEKPESDTARVGPTFVPRPQTPVPPLGQSPRIIEATPATGIDNGGHVVEIATPDARPQIGDKTDGGAFEDDFGRKAGGQ